MCTNDLYQCKDSSRINCTRACTTLGYIPCKNYVDTKICATILKNLLNKASNPSFRLNGNDQSGNNVKYNAEKPSPSLEFIKHIKNHNFNDLYSLSSSSNDSRYSILTEQNFLIVGK